jgi:hypothetical protein
MKRSIALGLALLFLVVLVPTLSAQYNKDLVVQKMRSNGALVGQINTAVGAEDFYASAERLMDLAANFKALEATDPPKGNKAEWDRINGDAVRAAFRGVGACGAENLEQLKAEVAAILALMKEGHAKFRG